MTEDDAQTEVLFDRLWEESAPELEVTGSLSGTYERPPCQVCGKTGPTHRHHWAPTSIFPDWPWENLVFLCEEHHNEWHNRMRAHGLRWPHKLAVRNDDDIQLP